MLVKLHKAGLVWPTLLTIPALAMLLSLGAWQWQRKAWKADLLARLLQSSQMLPVDIASILPRRPEEVRFQRVRLRGTLEHAQELHIWLPRDSGSAWRIVTPLRLSSGAVSGLGTTAPTHVLVIRGIVDDAAKPGTTRTKGQPLSEISLVGRVRLGSSNWATPEPDLKGNRWYALQLGEMSAAVSSKISKAVVAPFFVEAEEPLASPPAPQPHLAQLTLRNRHFEYAVTWWGLALTLIGVYIAFALGRLKQKAD